METYTKTEHLQETPQQRYAAADECYRQAVRAKQDMDARGTITKEEQRRLERAGDLIEASRMHRHLAAEALLLMRVRQDEVKALQQKIYRRSRLCMQTAIRGLMELAAVRRDNSARERLDAYLPHQPGPVIIQTDADGMPGAVGTVGIFGTNPPLGAERPARAALSDLATNVLAQRTRDWTFTERHRAEFMDEMLADVSEGDEIPAEEIDRWIAAHTREE